MKLGGFILKNSQILELSAFFGRALHCFLSWLVTGWINILIASCNSRLVNSPWCCNSDALGNFCSSTFLLDGWSLASLRGCIVIWSMRKHELDTTSYTLYDSWTLCFDTMFITPWVYAMNVANTQRSFLASRRRSALLTYTAEDLNTREYNSRNN